MNFQFYLEKLFASEDFEKFRKEFPEAFLCSGFFTIDHEGSDNQQHLDYYIPSVKKMYSFKLNENPVERVETEIHGEFTPKKLKDNLNFDFKKIEEQVSKKIGSEDTKGKILKMIFSLQNNDGKDYLMGTIFLPGMGLAKIIFDIDANKITEFEKKSFFDMVRFIGKKKEK